MGNKRLNLSCFSYLASGRVFTIEEYPKPNYGAEVLDIIDTLAADAPMVAVAASRLGLNEIMSCFTRNNVATEIDRNPQIKTPFIIVLSDKAGSREWFPYIPQAVSDLEQIKLDMIADSLLAYIDYYAIIRKVSQRAVDFASQHNIPSFINLGGSPFTSEILGYLRNRGIAIIQTNLDESEVQKAIPLAQDMFRSIKPEIAIVTLGSKGAVALNSSGVIRVPAYKVKVRHLHGIGAAFSAGYAFGYLKGWETEKSLRFARTLGSMSCTVETGFDAFSQRDVEKFIKERENNKAKH